MKTWQILKKGTFVGLGNKKVVVDDSVMDSIVNYAQQNANAREIPIVKGHPEIDSPKFGGIALSSFRREGDCLVAEPRWVDNQLQDEIVKGHYDACSLKFSPATGKVFHLGILGAHAPAVEGLEPISLSEFESDKDAIDIVCLADNRMPIVAAIMRRLRDKTIEEKGLEQADAIFNSYDIASLESYLPEVPEYLESEIDSLWKAIYGLLEKQEEKSHNLISLGKSEKMTMEEELQKEREARATAERVAAEAKAHNRRMQVEIALSSPELSGKITPAMKSEVAAIMDKLTEIDSIVEFSSGTGEVIKKPILESFKGILAQLPQAVSLSSPEGSPPSQNKEVDEAKELADLVNRRNSK